MAVMNHGVFEQVGAKLELYDNPETRFVASFVGSANRLSGELLAVDNGVAEVAWEGHKLRGPAPKGAPGDRGGGGAVDYFIKSERIAIGPRGAAGSIAGDTRLEGQLRDVIFKGQYADYFVTLPGGRELMVSGPPHVAGLTPRSEVVIAWPASAADVFAAETG
jgi:ABC-type Fe3+/spermidine/putrescine transport system ATPase subunit